MNKKVFYVDDDDMNLKALKRLFRNEPFDFITYDSPIKALSEIEVLKPAVVISDQSMPEMDGIVFLEKVKAKQPDSVRILLTGRADLEAAIAAINQGDVYRYIKKPWDDDQLKAEVKSALEHQDSICCLRNMVDSLADEVIENQAEQKSIRKLATAVCGDLGQPLMIIAGYTQLLQDQIKDEPIPQAYLSNILAQLNKIEELTKKIRSIAG